MADTKTMNGNAEEKYTPKNILLTGGAGFIASHVVIRFVKKYPQYKVVNFDKLDYCSCLANLDEVKDLPNYKFVKGNILSADLLQHVLVNEDIDTVMHFAAQTHVDNSFGNSFTFTMNNVLGTHVLLETCKTYGKIKRFIHVSTDEVYGEAETGEDQPPFFEDQVLEPTNPYAATKAGAEFIVKSYHRSFQMPVIITRGNNVYGPHQYPEKVIPKFINQLLRGRSLTIHGSGCSLRNFLYVTDVANAFDFILHNGSVGKVYNVAGRCELSVLTVAKELLKAMGLEGKEGELLKYVEDRSFNDLRYHIDDSQLRAMGWQEEVQWEEGLKNTIEWYKKYTSRYGNIESALAAHPRPGVLPSDADADADAKANESIPSPSSEPAAKKQKTAPALAPGKAEA